MNHQISWDGNQQNAGVIGFTPDGGVEITAAARDRYNSLIQLQPAFAQAGHSFPSPLIHDDGVTPMNNGHFEIDAEHFKDWAEMTRWHRALQK